MQKIDTIEIKNFKSIRHQKIEGCKRINVFIGEPNVGKSNTLEALGFLTFIPVNRKPLKLKGLVRYEKLTQLFNYFNAANPAVINFNSNYFLEIKYEDEEALRLSLASKKRDNPGLGFQGMLVGHEKLNFSSSDHGEIKGILVDDFSGRFKELQNFNVKPYKFSSDKIFNESHSALELKVPFGRNLFELVVNNAEIQKEFSELLMPYGLDLVIDVSSNDVKISPPIKNGIIQTIPLSLMADTLIRLIFFKTAIISNKNSILIFEEPEAHMFPPYISKFTTDIVFDKNDNQFFIATHSPFVINDFMENLKKDEYSIYTVGYSKDTGETLIRRMTDEELHEIYQYGVDLFLNLENYLPQENNIHEQQQ